MSWLLNHLSDVCCDWRTLIVLGPPVILIAAILYYQWRRSQIYRQWLGAMRRCAGIPDCRDLGDGWIEVKCNNCYHIYLVWEDDENICTKCGVHYWKTDKIDKR